MMEKFKTPLPKCSRGTKWEAPIISIQTEQKAFCSLIYPAPGPLPLPQPPWQQRNIWERTPEQSIKPGGRPIICPQQSGLARSTPPGLNPFINSPLLPCIQEAKVALMQPLTLTCSHFPCHRLWFHILPPTLSSSFSSYIAPAWPDNAPSLKATPVHWGVGGRRGRRRERHGTGAQQGAGSLILFPC